MLKNMKMVYKIGGGFALVTLFTLLIAVMSVSFTGNARDAVRTGETISSEITRIDTVGDSVAAFFRSGNPGDAKTAKDSVQKTLGALNALRALEKDAETKQLISAAAALLEPMAVQLDSAKPQPGIPDPAEPKLKQDLENALKALTKVQDLVTARTARDLGSSMAIILVTALAALLSAVVFTVILTKNVTDPLDELVKNAESIAEGRLDIRLGSNLIARKDEVGVLALAVTRMLERLTDFVTEMQGVASGVATGGKSLSETSSRIASGASKQAASVEQVSASMEQMSSSIRQSAENATQTERIARMSSQAAADGGTAVMETLDAMREIASKIGIIEEIARSTNMLSLNASIEAARAGEYGKGFAVVASEVGKLAERSQKEAGEISTLSLSSVEIAEKAGETITALVPDIKRTADLVQEISAALNEQKSGIESINGAITQLDRVVQENASSSEQSSAMADDLASQAERMKSLIGFFGTSAAGAAATGATQRAVPKPAESMAPAAKKAVPAETPPLQKPTSPKPAAAQIAAAPKAATPKPPSTGSLAGASLPPPKPGVLKSTDGKPTTAKSAAMPAPAKTDKPASPQPSPISPKPAAAAEKAVPAAPAAPATVAPPKAAAPAKPASANKSTPAAAPGPSASAKQRLPLTGIHLVLDDDVLPHGSDDLDNDFKEF